MGERREVKCRADQIPGRVEGEKRHGEHSPQRSGAPRIGMLGRRVVSIEIGQGRRRSRHRLPVARTDGSRPSARPVPEDRRDRPPVLRPVLAATPLTMRGSRRPMRLGTRLVRERITMGADGTSGLRAKRPRASYTRICTDDPTDTHRQRSRHVAQDTLTITDNRTGKSYEVPVADGTIKAIDLRQIKVSDDDFGLMTYDPAFMNTAACRSAITYIDGDKGHPALSRLSHRAARRAGQLPRGGLAAEGRRAADRRPSSTSGPRHQVSHLRPHQHHQVPRGLPLRRASHGDAARRRRRALDLLSRRQGHPRSGQPLLQRVRLLAKTADHRGVRLPALARPAVRLSATTISTTSGTSST